MNCHTFLRFLVAAAVVSGLIKSTQGLGQPTGAMPGGQADQNRLNILFIVSDDCNDWVGAFGGNPDTKTPNLDSLCSRGVAFERAYTCSPLCNPTRAAIMNGKRPSNTGIYDNRQPFRQSEALRNSATLPQYLMLESGVKSGGKS